MMGSVERRVTRAQFRRPLEPIWRPELIASPRRGWTDREWDRIQIGFMSLDMNDHWHALVEDDHLYLYRSWTGYEIYDATFTRTHGRWHITHAVVEAHPDRYQRGDDEHEARQLERCVELVLYRDTYR